MAQTAEIKIAGAAARDEAAADDLTGAALSVRVSANSYFVGAFLATFFAAFCVYLEQDALAAVFVFFGWIFLPFLAWNDRIVFDGERIFRTGFAPNLWARLNRRSRNLSTGEIEQIETQAHRALKRGGNVFYRYRTTVTGRRLRFAFASGGEEYRRMAARLFAAVSPDALDNRSIELRDYLSEPKETLMKAEFERIPSAEVLENSINDFASGRHLKSGTGYRRAGAEPGERVEYLRRLANELRVSGNLLQALETFRRALHLNSRDAWLIFEFARCLHSYASAERDRKLQRKATAALRLAELRAGTDAELLSRVGESYFQYGEWRLARRAFYKTLNIASESFRAVRGLAEIALREGQIAHVIHHFSSATHFAENNAVRRWARGETEYFTRLNSDEEYMESEIRRLNLLENVERGRKTALRAAGAAILLAVCGMIWDETAADVGWIAASIALLAWAGLIMTRNVLAERSDFAEQD